MEDQTIGESTIDTLDPSILNVENVEVGELVEEAQAEATQEDNEQQDETSEQPVASTETEESATEETTEETTDGEATQGDIFDVVDLAQDDANTEVETSSQETSNTYEEILDGSFKDSGEVNEYVSGLEREIAELKEGRAEEGTFVNDLTKSFNDYIAGGGTPELFMKVQGTNVKELDPQSAMELNLMWNNDLSAKDAKAYIQSKYKLDPEKYDEDEVRMGNMAMQIDSKEAVKQLESYQHENALPEKSTQDAEIEQKNMDRMNEWFAPIDDAAKNVRENGIVIPIGKGGKGLNFKPDISQDMMESFENLIYQSGSDNPTVEEAQEQLEALIHLANKDTIYQAIAENSRSMTDEQWFNKVHNPSAKDKGDAPSHAPQEGQSVEDQIANFS